MKNQHQSQRTKGIQQERKSTGHIDREVFILMVVKLGTISLL